MKNTIRTVFILAFFLTTQLSAQVLINELKVNAPGNDDPYEFIEIRGTPNATLNNIYVCIIEGDSSNPGVLDRVFRINNKTLGSSGIMLFATSLGYQDIADDCLFQDTLVFGIPSGIIENGSNTFAIFFSPVPFVVGTDYDTTNDGTLELPPGAIMMDAVGWTNGNLSAIVYGGAILSQVSGTPDAAVRFYNNTTPFSSAAWYCGDLIGTASSLQFDSLEVSSNFPAGQGLLTPGSHNQPGFSSVLNHPQKSLLKVFPNPVSHQIFFSLPENEKADAGFLRIFNSQGVLVKSLMLNTLRSISVGIDINELSDGYYFLEFANQKHVYRSGFLKNTY